VSTTRPGRRGCVDFGVGIERPGPCIGRLSSPTLTPRALDDTPIHQDRAEFHAKAEQRKAQENEDSKLDARARKRRERDPLHQGIIVARGQIKARNREIDLAANLGRTRMEAGREAGFYCEVCDCTLKDSLAWLDHLNGVYHNRALGLDVADIERSTVDQVKKRLERAKKRKKGEILAEEDGGDAPLLLMDGKAGDSSDDGNGSDDDDDSDGDGNGSGSEGESEDEDEGAGGSGEDDEAAAMQKMMGFGSFGA